MLVVLVLWLWILGLLWELVCLVLGVFWWWVLCSVLVWLLLFVGLFVGFGDWFEVMMFEWLSC